MKKIIVLTGAGISAESGIKTFRDSDGLWENHRVEDVATYEAWEHNPKLVMNFYNERRKQLFEVEPNKAHYDLVKLEKDFDVTVITQNIDDLHERAGSSNVMHLHGELKKLRSETDPNYILELDSWEHKLTDLDSHGRLLRPDIVWFGEAVPMIEKAAEECMEADIMIVVGTSLQVYPAAGLLHYVRSGTAIYLVDPKQPNVNLSKIKYYKEGAVAGVEKVVTDILENHL